MKKRPQITFDTVRHLALDFPNVEESTSYGTPALKVKGKLFVRQHEDRDVIVIKVAFDQREEMMTTDPETYFITDHYLEYEWMLVRLSRVHQDALRDLLQASYRAALPTKHRRV